MIFISHSSKDKEIGENLLKLLLAIGILSRNIIFTSKSGYGIPAGNNIFEWLKSKLLEKPFVIYLLSDNYYDSIPCLNEMGASWVVESKHVSMFTPKFDLTADKFINGAIDPREIGLFINKKDDIFRFVEMITTEFKLQVPMVLLNNAVDEYISRYELFVQNQSTSLSSNFNVVLSNSAVSNTVDINSFYELITNNKLIDEELLILLYLNDLGKVKLGDRWMAGHELLKIREWEEDRNLQNLLSRKYSDVLTRLINRNLVIPINYTDYGNPKEYELIESIKSCIFDFPKEVIDILIATSSKYIKTNDPLEGVSLDIEADIPF